MTVLHVARTPTDDYLDVKNRGRASTYRRDRKTGVITRRAGCTPLSRYAIWTYVSGPTRAAVEAAFKAEFA